MLTNLAYAESNYEAQTRSIKLRVSLNSKFAWDS